MPLSRVDAASKLLSPAHMLYGFVYQSGDVDRGWGGLYAHGEMHERTVRWNSACALRSVWSGITSMPSRSCTKTSPESPGQCEPGLSDDRL